MKTFGLHFRQRRVGGIGPDDIGMICNANSQKEAKAIGKRLAEGLEKTWFVGLISVESAKATGGQLE